MITPRQLTTPITTVIFDCDGTLSTIEGIDELAITNDVSAIVQRLTQEAMGETGMSADLYKKRLDLVKPSHQQLLDLGQDYINHQAPDVLEVINIFKRLNKSIYIISAGLLPSVTIFAKHLQIPQENVYAVDIKFDSTGNYLDFDRHSPMINQYGKREIVDKIKLAHSTTAFIGDGLSDYEVYDLVTRFVGYGGAYYRESIEKRCEFYIKDLSMAALLPLLLTENESTQLTDEEKVLYQKGLEVSVMPAASLRARGHPNGFEK